MKFAILQFQKKCPEQNHELHTIFVDLTKAFDMVSSVRLIQMVYQFHEGMRARVVVDGRESAEAFPIINCFAHTVQHDAYCDPLSDAFQDSDAGTSLKYRVDGKLFNPRVLQATLQNRLWLNNV